MRPAAQRAAPKPRPQARAAAAQPHPRRGAVEPGDEVYVQHPEHGPLAVKVLACGRDGLTGECAEGRRHGVPYDAMLGHKKRVAMDMRVMDQGADGAIVEDARGRRHFLAGDPGAPPPEGARPPSEETERADDPLLDRLDGLLAKAAAGQGVVLFLKAGPIANGPGLALRDVTDRAGHRTKRWMRTAPDVKQPRQPGKGAAPAAAPAPMRHGDEVTFRHGDVQHSGKIVAAGADGVTVRDAEGRTHQVRHGAIEGAAPGGEKKPLSPHKLDHPDHRPSAAGVTEPSGFSATAHFQKHDHPEGATVEAILGQFPPDTAKKMAAVLDRLHGVTETHVQHKAGGEYTPERQELHRKIVAHILPEHLIQAARPPEGQKPTYTILGGRGGSGKSWFKGRAYDPSKAVVLDADEIKQMLPEYEGWNAFQVHEESGEIFDRISQIAMALGLNIVHDATMKTPAKAVALVQKMKEAGYRVEAHYMHLPRAQAAERAIRRFLGPTGRFVPPEVILDNKLNEAAFDQVKEHADAWSFRDNQGEGGPTLIAQGGEGARAAGGARDDGEDGRDGRAAAARGRGAQPNQRSAVSPSDAGREGQGQALKDGGGPPLRKALLAGIFFWRR